MVRPIPWTALALLLAARVAIAQTGTLVGRVTNALTGAPVTVAQVTVTGTPLTARVDADGQFHLPNVPITAHEARARRLGYQPAGKPPVNLDGATLVAEFRMQRAIDFYLTGQRLGDLRRYAEAGTDLFPTGKYPTLRDSYGTMHCFIVPLSEKSSNPNY